MICHENNASNEILLGQWGAIESKGRPLDGETLTITFTPEGKLISIIRDGDETVVFNHEYRVSSNELFLRWLHERANQNESRLRFWIDEAGNLVWEEGQNGISRFKRL